jgi:hypothetical protein
MDIVPADRGKGNGGHPPRLLPQHLADLRDSGLSDSQIAACGFYSESAPAAVAKVLGWKRPAAGLGACLCFPFRDRGGNDTGHVMVKPDQPRQKNGKAVKYESPAGKPLRVYIPPNTRAALADPSVPLLLTEGMKKAAKADQEGFACLGLVGVYGWQTKRPAGPDGKKSGPRELIPDLAAVAWAGRAVTIVYDSDLADKPDVARAEWHLADALGRLGAVVKVARLPGGACGAKVGLDDFLVARGPDALRLLIETARPATKPAGSKGTTEKPPGSADLLAGIGLAADLWHDSTATAFATIGRHTYGVRSKGFRQYLVNEYRKLTNGKVPNAEALTNALAVIEAAGVHDGPERPAHVRMAGHDGRVYLHLADADSTVIETDAQGWRVCPEPPVRFRKPAGMLPLPMPERGGAMTGLRAFLNVPDDAGVSLVVAWLMGCLQPDGPFPVLGLLGEQGSAKTTTARVLKNLIDPSAALVRSEPKEPRDLMIQARNNWVLAFDNLSGLPGWLSDALCRLATGGGFSTRELYSNDDEVIFDAKRPLIVNGIEDFMTRADLLERSLLIRHPPIPEQNRRPESEFWAAFDAAHAKLLGAVLDRVSAGLRERPTVKPAQLPRMADFALFAAACECGAGEKPNFLSAYADNQAGAHEQALDASPIPAALLALMDDRDTWEGKPADLLAALGTHAPNPASRDWPKRPNVLTNKLRRLAPDLRRVHRLNVDCDGRAPDRKRTRVVTIARYPESGRAPSSASSAPPADGPIPAETVPAGGRWMDGAGEVADDPHTPRPSAPSPEETSTSDDADGTDGVARLPLGRRRFGNNDTAYVWR